MAARKRPTTTPGPGRVVLYIRVSALMGRSGDDFHSPQLQLDTMRRHITSIGLREVAVIDDDIDFSGQTFDRPGVNRIRAMVENRHVDVVAVHDLSRVGRNLSEGLEFIKWLRKHGVSVISTQEKIDDSPEGQFMLGMWLNLAELFGNQIGRKWAQILERRARLGKPHGHTPQGYLRIDGNYIIDPVLGPAIAAMFTAYAAGATVGSIADTYAAARGKPIDRSTIKRMLRNPTYRGRVVLNSSTAGLLDLPGTQPRLVDDETWQRVARRLEEDHFIPPRTLAPGYALTGFGLCATCRRHLQVRTDRRSSMPTRLHCAYVTKNRDCTGIGTPGYHAIEKAVLGEVERYAARLHGNPGALAARHARTARAGVDATLLERELAKTRQAVSRLTEGWARGTVPDEAYRQAVERLSAAEKAQEVQLAEIRDAVDAPEPDMVVNLVGRLLDLWPDLSAAERNQGLKTVLKSFTVRRAKRWREPEAERVTVQFRW